MSRTIWAAIAGWITLVVMVYGLHWLAFWVMGPDATFQPAIFDLTPTAAAVSAVLMAIAGVAAGIVCITAGGTRTSIAVLSITMLGMGLLITGESLNTPESPMKSARLAPVATIEALRRARPPDWATVVNPLIAVFGVVLGGALQRRPT